MELRPGSLVKPWNNAGMIPAWEGVIYGSMGQIVEHMKGPSSRLEKVSIVVCIVNSGDEKCDAVLLWSSEPQRCVWTWDAYLCQVE